MFGVEDDEAISAACAPMKNDRERDREKAAP
jgi:hypothetical protein